MYYRIRTYYCGGENDGRWTGFDHWYFAQNSCKALEKAKRDYPEHEGCYWVCEEAGTMAEFQNTEIYKVAFSCGCVHFW